MIKLKNLIDEIERANQLDASKIYWTVRDEEDGLYITMFIKGYEGSNVYRNWRPFNNRELFGGIRLSKTYEGQKKGYLLIYTFEVEEPVKGYGELIFRRAMEEAKKLGYTGIASQREFRSQQASDFWKKVIKFSDSQFDYAS